ncbi:hypothetical protein MNV49_002399 [Pseudohyphozyma bogoriensis]|nr:hypothetical protein MNV49_002399 [Pseudohyphozyma bogoriensis]
MHRLLQPGFSDVHLQILDQLASSPSIHEILPLLGVNRHFRRLVVDKLVKQYSRTKLVKVKETSRGMAYVASYSQGERISVYQSSFCPPQGAMQTDDPRWFLGSKDAPKQAAATLLFDSIDPKTLICTFKPPCPTLEMMPSKSGKTDKAKENARMLAEAHFSTMEYTLACDEQAKEYSDVPVSFKFIMSPWFRPAERKAKGVGLFGFELGGRPNRFPECGSDWWPEASDEPNGKVEFDSKRCTWEIEGFTERADWIGCEATRYGFGLEVPCMAVIKSLKIPLIDLFCPRTTLKKKGYYSDYYQEENPGEKESWEEDNDAD